VAATSFKTLFDEANFGELVVDYSAEGRIPGLPEPAVKLAKYQTLEQAGLIYPFGAWHEDRLVGFLCVMVTSSTHYDAPVVFTESFFVARDARSSGAGLALLKMAEAKARDLGANGLLISAPCGSRLAAMLPRLGYTDTSHSFFKRFDDA
jgi:GNAT superfamily N-acetyltransferase